MGFGQTYLELILYNFFCFVDKTQTGGGLTLCLRGLLFLECWLLLGWWGCYCTAIQGLAGWGTLTKTYTKTKTKTETVSVLQAEERRRRKRKGEEMPLEHYEDMSSGHYGGKEQEVFVGRRRNFEFFFLLLYINRFLCLQISFHLYGLHSVQ